MWRDDSLHRNNQWHDADAVQFPQAFNFLHQILIFPPFLLLYFADVIRERYSYVDNPCSFAFLLNDQNIRTVKIDSLIRDNRSIPVDQRLR